MDSAGGSGGKSLDLVLAEGGSPSGANSCRPMISFTVAGFLTHVFPIVKA